jgi:hypothetical protein
VACIIAGVVGCGVQEKTNLDDLRLVGTHQKVETWTLVEDTATGCQYIRADKGSVTPRLGTDGKPLGCGQTK